MDRRGLRRSATWALGVVCALGACAPAPTGRLAVMAASPAQARLELRFERPQGARRGLLAAAQASSMRVTVDGPDLAAPVTATGTLGADSVTVAAVPAGARRVITLEGLDAAGAAIPGATAFVVGELKAGDNALVLSGAGSVAGDVAKRLLAKDRAASTQVLAQLAPADMLAAVKGYVTGLNARHPALLDAQAIADAVAGGAMPAASSGFLRQAARLVVRPRHLAPGVSYRATLTDPISGTAGFAEAAATVIEPAAPGSWTLILEADRPGVPAVKQAVTLAAGQTLEVAVDLAGTQAVAALPIPYAPAGSVVLGTTLFGLGGTSYNAAGGPQFFQGVVTYAPDAGWGSGGDLAATRLESAVAVYVGKVYFFGGQDGTSVLGTCGVFTPGAPGTVGAIAGLPGGLKVRGASAASMSGKIYLAGGYDEADQPNQAVLAYDPVGNAWSTEALAPMLPAVRGMASAAVGGKMYLFGGMLPAPQLSNGQLLVLETPQSGVSVYTPGPSASWGEKKPMPTPRGLAAAVVVSGKIWVIGGAGALGRPSRAVEVYDPATDTWEVRAPLRTPRAGPAAGLIGGKIVVAGGLDGDSPFDALALDAVEEITP